MKACPKSEVRERWRVAEWQGHDSGVRRRLQRQRTPGRPQLPAAICQEMLLWSHVGEKRKERETNYVAIRFKMWAHLFLI